jgi:serine/threonine-protein kinase HipA
MAKRTTYGKLHIWMNGELVGLWEQTPRGTVLQYFDEWLQSERARPLSLSLPFTPDNQPYRDAKVTAFFDNLLPDSDAIRLRLAQQYQTTGTSPFELLAKIGRDCAGAIQLLPIEEEPTGIFQISGITLNPKEIAQILRDATSSRALGNSGPDRTLRLSIAGAQEKTALLFHDGQWTLPIGSTPTTHIFKLPMGIIGNMKADMRTSVENEWLCSKIMNAFDIPIAQCEMAQFEDQKALVVTRFDRKLSSDANWIIRLPQEDFCQATGTSPIQKYQSDGGPGIAKIMEILLGSNQAQQDRLNFYKTQIIFWVLAATDGHAKNFSIAHLPQNQYQATPIYDVLSAHPIIGRSNNQIASQDAKLAMAVRSKNNHYQIEKIIRRHWLAQAEQVQLGADAAADLIADIILSTPQVINVVSKLLPKDFPADVADSIFNGMLRQIKKLAGS